MGQIIISHHRVKEVKEITKVKKKSQKASLPFSPGLTTLISMKELEEAMKLLKAKQARGQDKVTNDMLTHLGPIAKKKMRQIFNASWKSGKIPNIWKKAIMIPVLKRGKPRNKVDSYRPISLTSCVCKLMERVVNNRLTWILESIF